MGSCVASAAAGVALPSPLLPNIINKPSLSSPPSFLRRPLGLLVASPISSSLSLSSLSLVLGLRPPPRLLSLPLTTSSPSFLCFCASSSFSTISSSSSPKQQQLLRQQDHQSPNSDDVDRHDLADKLPKGREQGTTSEDDEEPGPNNVKHIPPNPNNPTNRSSPGVPNLSVKEKKELASYAHSLLSKKKLKSQQVGKSGVTPSVAASFLETLEANELLKLKIHSSCPGELAEVVEQLEAATGSVAVDQIGRSVILYRPSLSKMKKKEGESPRRQLKPYSTSTSRMMQNKGREHRRPSA